MSERWVQHIGDDQLVAGLSKRMSASSGHGDASTSGKTQTYWCYHPKPNACDKCQAMVGLWFEERPGPIHPNCKCEIEPFRAIKVTGRSHAIIVPPGVNLTANIAEARRIKRICEMYEFVIYPYKSASFFLKCAWVYLNFKPEAKYDYKKDGHPEYEDFGNYHYGLYTKALGINVEFAQAAAGFFQWLEGTSSKDFSATWFDDPRDNAMVRKGQSSPLQRESVQ